MQKDREEETEGGQRGDGRVEMEGVGGCWTGFAVKSCGFARLGKDFI